MSKITTLSQICDALSDGLHKAPVFNPTGEYLFVNATNLEKGYIVDKDEGKRADFSEYQKYGVELNDRTVLYSIDGTIGNIARYRGEKVILGKGACYLMVKNGVDPDYIYFLLQSEAFNEYIRKMSTGSTIHHISLETIRNFKFQLPDYDTQKSISSVLMAMENKIHLNVRLAAELESMAKTIYDYWFTQFDFPDADDKPYRSSGGAMEWNAQHKKEIPQGWLATTMSALTTVVTGKEDANFSTPHGKYKFFTCAQETIHCDTPAFSGHAVLIAGNGDFNVKHYTGHFNAYQRTYVLIPNDDKYYAIMYIAAQQRIRAFKQGSNGSIVKFITKGDVENIPLLIPEDKSLLEPLNKILEKIEHCERENDELIKLRDWLLPMLMKGQAIVAE